MNITRLCKGTIVWFFSLNGSLNNIKTGTGLVIKDDSYVLNQKIETDTWLKALGFVDKNGTRIAYIQPLITVDNKVRLCINLDMPGGVYINNVKIG